MVVVASTLLFFANLLPFVMMLLLPLFAILLFAYQYYVQKNKAVIFTICWVSAVAIGVFASIYRPAGFAYPLVFHANELHSGGLPFDLYINIAKALAGYIIVFFLVKYEHGDAYVISPVKQLLLIMFFASVALFCAYFLLDLKFYVKDVKYIALFGAVNLLVTCVAEEAFMRILLQDQITRFFRKIISYKFSPEFLSLFLTTIIFVLIHAIHGMDIICVYAVAGFLYGLIYLLTKNLFMAIVVHFIVNIMHFSLLTYPI